MVNLEMQTLLSGLNVDIITFYSFIFASLLGFLPLFRYLDANGIEHVESTSGDVISEIGRLTQLTKLYVKISDSRTMSNEYKHIYEPRACVHYSI